jgi:hypothetical protein
VRNEEVNMNNSIDNFLKEFIYGKNITYQKISLSNSRNENYNTYILNDWDNQISVTLVDKIEYSASDPNIYFDFIKHDDTSMYQIKFNSGLLNEPELFIILSEIFDKKDTNIHYLETLMKPLFNTESQ